MPAGVKYGLSAQEFYSLNPAKMMRYQPFFIEKYNREKEEVSEVGWTNGLYVSRAIDGVMPKGKKYPDAPLEIYVRSEEEEEVEHFSDADRFRAFAEMFNKGRSDLKTIEEKEAEQANTPLIEDTVERQSGVPEIGGVDHE